MSLVWPITSEVQAPLYTICGGCKSYAEVKKMAPYGEAILIPKEDCIGHVTKRMGTALRKLVYIVCQFYY